METRTSDQSYPIDQAHSAGQALPVGQPRPAEIDDDEISLIDLVATLLRHKKLIIGMTMGAAVAVVLFAIGSLLLAPEKSYLPNVYTSKAVLLVSESSSGGLSSAIAASGLGSLASLAGVSAGGASNGLLAVLIAKSNTTIDELNAEFDFTSRYEITKSVIASTRKAVLGNYNASYDEKTRTVSITFEDIDPQFTMRVVNRAVEILDRRFATLGGNRVLGQKMLLEAKLADVQVSITRAEAEIQKFTTRHGVVSIDALATEQVTVLARLRSELILKDMEIENYEKFSRIDDPVIRRLRGERDSIRAKITELDRGTGGLLPSRQQLPVLAFEYSALQRDLLIQMEIFKLLTQQYELAKLNSEGQEPAFQVLEPAEAPDLKSGPSRGMICVVATMAAFFLSVLLAFLLEAVKNIRNDPEAMKKLGGRA
jgi:uncharacterized protein involved in exopolysaccharide biosynthesis